MKLEKRDGDLYVKEERVQKVFVYDEDVPEGIDRTKYLVIVVLPNRKRPIKQIKIGELK